MRAALIAVCSVVGVLAVCVLSLIRILLELVHGDDE